MVPVDDGGWRRLCAASPLADSVGEHPVVRLRESQQHTRRGELGRLPRQIVFGEATRVARHTEVACQALMRAHAAAGNRAEALRVFANCRKLFRDELGAEPSEQTAAVFLGILRVD